MTKYYLNTDTLTIYELQNGVNETKYRTYDTLAKARKALSEAKKRDIYDGLKEINVLIDRLQERVNYINSLNGKSGKLGDNKG